MAIQFIGLLTFLVGIICWFTKPAISIYALFICTLLGASAAIILTSLGSANIQPAHLLLGFVAAYAMTKKDYLQSVFEGIVFPRAGFWLVLTAIYAAVSALLFPRLFAGDTYVFTIARTDLGSALLLTPLGPVSGNITQTIYFIGGIICFLVFYAFCGSASGMRAACHAALACAVVNLAFCVIDLATFWTGTTELLSFLRNANYRMLDDVLVVGFKRIVGSFPEASSFGYATLPLFAFSFWLWLSGFYRRLTAFIAACSFLALVFSTSSTAYVGMFGFLGIAYLIRGVQALLRPVPVTTLIFLFVAPMVMVLVLLGMMLHEPTWAIASDLVDTTILNKLDSQSGVERSRWNTQALVNLVDTNGFGGGVGSVRASSFPIAVLGNIGVFGGAAYAMFFACLFFDLRKRWDDPFLNACQSGARAACATQLIAASVAGSFIDLGLPFFIFAAVSYARPIKRGGRATETPRTAAPRALPAPST